MQQGELTCFYHPLKFQQAPQVVLCFPTSKFIIEIKGLFFYISLWVFPGERYRMEFNQM
jgi:hypothetical protein